MAVPGYQEFMLPLLKLAGDKAEHVISDSLDVLASQGVFITSGTFTDGALRAAREAALKVRLIDGEELAELMIDFGVGVATSETYVIKRVDTDFFEGAPSL
jgi:restriction endonuclease Mrr